MKMKFLGFLAAGALLFVAPASSFASLILSVPSSSQAIPASATDFVADVTFSTGGSTAQMDGYDVAFQITGPNSNLTITGVSTGASRPSNTVFADDPTFFTNTSTGTTLYGVSDFLISGTGTITNGSILVELKLHAAAGTSGTYQINFDTNSQSALNSVLYTDAALDPVPNLTFQGGTITFSNPVPEPASLSLLGSGIVLLLNRRRCIAGPR